jgi:hypothetical protein
VPGLLTLLVFVLSLVSYFCSFGGSYGVEVLLLLAGGLLAAFHLLPRGPKTLPFAVLLSLVGGLGALAAVISRDGGSLPTAYVLVLVFGLAQAAVAVAALLFDWDLIKLPPRPAVPHGYQPGPGYGQGPFPGQQGPQQGQPPSAPFGQQAPQTQSTQFLQQPGQFGGFTPPGNE